MQVWDELIDMMNLKCVSVIYIRYWRAIPHLQDALASGACVVLCQLMFNLISVESKTENLFARGGISPSLKEVQNFWEAN